MTPSTDHRPGHSCRHLVPGAPVELTPTGLRPDPTVLLVEERDPRLAALIADRPHPAEVDRSRTGPGLAAGDHPVQPCPAGARERTHPAARQVMLPALGEPEAHRTEKRLGRHEPDHGRVSSRAGMRMSAHFWFSTLTPSHTFGSGPVTSRHHCRSFCRRSGPAGMRLITRL